MVSIETRTDVQQRPLYSLHHNSQQILLLCLSFNNQDFFWALVRTYVSIRGVVRYSCVVDSK